MKWSKLKTKLRKDKKNKDDRAKRITKIKGSEFMVETEIDKKTKRFSKVDIGLNELNELKKQKYIK